MVIKISAFLCIVIVLFIVIGCLSTNKKVLPRIGQHPQSFEKEITKIISGNYLLYLPQEYETNKKILPLMLFLHGAGERGNDLELVKKHGPPKRVEGGKDFPFIIVSPQCPQNQWWSIEFLNTLLDEVISKYRVDEDRIYVTGLSMGGFGTWHLATEYPHRFAAIAPICGGGSPYDVCKIKHLPVWVFHGAKDETVPLNKSEEMVNALKNCGGDVKFTVYPLAAHDSWTETYNNPQLYDWFLQHQRKQVKE
jgi:predicted peptidase